MTELVVGSSRAWHHRDLGRARPLCDHEYGEPDPRAQSRRTDRRRAPEVLVKDPAMIKAYLGEEMSLLRWRSWRALLRPGKNPARYRHCGRSRGDRRARRRQRRRQERTDVLARRAAHALHRPHFDRAGRAWRHCQAYERAW